MIFQKTFHRTAVRNFIRTHKELHELLGEKQLRTQTEKEVLSTKATQVYHEVKKKIDVKKLKADLSKELKDAREGNHAVGLIFGVGTVLLIPTLAITIAIHAFEQQPVPVIGTFTIIAGLLAYLGRDYFVGRENIKILQKSIEALDKQGGVSSK